MKQKILLLLPAIFLMRVDVHANDPDSSKDYLELIEAEIVESLCEDGAFRRATHKTWRQCADQAQQHLADCASELRHLAPRDDGAHDPKRLTSDAFAAQYRNCLKRELTE